MRRDRGRASVLVLSAAVAAVAVGAAEPARAVERFYIGPASGAGAVWGTATNWNTSPFGGAAIGVPGPADLAYHAVSSATDRTMALNIDASVLEFHLGNNGGGSNNVTQTTAVNLTANIEHVGSGGDAVHTQTAGTNTYNSFLAVGSTTNASFTGTYNLSGTGIVRTPSTSGGLFVGALGVGTFNQTGGAVTVGTVGAAAPLYVGYFSNAHGTYNLGGTGTLTTHGNVHVGHNDPASGVASGTMVQDGGTHTNTGAIWIGNRPGSSGSYSLSGSGVLNAAVVQVGRNERATGAVTGSFNQNGGTHTASKLYVGFSGGGGQATGGYTLGGTGALTVNGDEFIGFSEFGVSGAAATGAFTQNGGTHGVVNLGVGGVRGASGSYSMTAGNLNVANDLNVGWASTEAAGSGTFSHSGGTVAVANTVNVASATSAGRYALSGTGNLAAVALGVHGTFTQSGGTMLLGLGAAPEKGAGIELGGNGVYTMTGGSATVHGVGLFSGDAPVVNHTGGTLTFHPGTGVGGNILPSMFFVSPEPGKAATYNLGGTATLTLNVPAQIGGVTFSGITALGENGVLNISGGATMTVNEALTIFDSAGTAVNLSGGSLSVRSIRGAYSRFHWTGGSLTFTDPSTPVAVGPEGLFGNLTLVPGMSLTAPTVTIEAGGRITRNGGGLSVTNTLVLAGGTIDGAAALNNGAQITGNGTIGGSGGFNNLGSVDVDSGVLVLTNTGANSNDGAVAVDAGAQLKLSGGALSNTGVVQLAAGGAITGAATITNHPGGSIRGAGSIAAPVNNAGGAIIAHGGALNFGQPLANAGTIELDGAGARLLGSAVANNGLITGRGLVSNVVTNNAAGEIRAEAGNRLTFAAMPAANAGKIVLEGGTAEFTGPLTNGATGVIRGRGVLRAPAGLTNNGQVQFVGGVSDVYGAVASNSGSKVVVSAAGTAIFYNAVTMNAGSELRVGAGSTAVFFDVVSGGGAFTGSGTKIFEAGASAPAAIATTDGDTIVQPAATVTTGHLREDAVTVDGVVTIRPEAAGAATSRVNALSIGKGGRLDLADNKLIVAGGDLGASDGATYTGLTRHIQTAYQESAWTGSGLTTSMPDAATGLTTLAIATAEQTGLTTFGGVPVVGDDVLVMYTYGGDTNFDGKLDADDYGTIDFSVLLPGVVDGYYNGDFNYDGVVNADDYGVIDFNILAQGEPFATGGAAAASLSGVTAVPEPASVALLGMGAAGAFVRRRRRVIA